MAPFYSLVQNIQLYSMTFTFGIRPKHLSKASEISIRHMHPQPNIASDQISDFIWENLILSFPNSLWNSNLTLSHGIWNQDYPHLLRLLSCFTIHCFKQCVIHLLYSRDSCVLNSLYGFLFTPVWRPLLTHLQCISYFLLTEFTVGGDQIHNQIQLCHQRSASTKSSTEKRKSFHWSEWSQLKLMWEECF